MTTAQCLDEESILAFAEGRLDEPAVKGLESHARSCVTCSELITAALGAVHGGTPPRTAAGRAAPISRGTSIGRYVVLGPVGRGGMGEVFAAYDPELDRRVA